MGPRHRGRGNFSPRHGPSLADLGFNGAASQRTRKWQEAPVMGWLGDMLQWGRVTEDAEIS